MGLASGLALGLGLGLGACNPCSKGQGAGQG